MPHVRVKEVEQYAVPVPSLAEQAHIVAILDKFDALTNSLTEGLPGKSSYAKSNMPITATSC